jgi:molecular chaperone HscB
MSAPCWNCGKAAAGLFCESCRAIQAPPAGIFELFGLPRSLAIDRKDLEQRFYSLSRRLHPDLFSRKSERERQYSTDVSALLNDGYRILRDPVRRAEYVLKENGLPIGEQGTKHVPADLLEEVFELNMAMEEIRHGDPSVRPHLEEAGKRFGGMLDEVDADLERAFTEYDQSRDQEVLGRIRGHLNRRKYISNLLNEVNVALQRAA